MDNTNTTPDCLSPFLDEDGHIVATCINSGYFDYLQNLVENIKRADDVPWTICVVCMDAEAFQKCVNANIPALPLNHAHYDDGELCTYSSWNDANWNRTTFMKLDAIRWLISFPAVKSITYMDSDIHIYRDFVPYLKQLAANHPTTELFIQSDHNSKNPDEYGKTLCSGFFHFRNAAHTVVGRIFQYVEEDVAKYTFNADQDHITAQISQYNVPMVQLDRALFPNGVFVDQLPTLSLSSSPYIIHYNYIIGNEKKKKMFSKGHWYLTYLNMFHHKNTGVTYPPFKNGMYLEEYFSRHNTVRGNRYIDVFWTNLQIRPKFRQLQPTIQKIVNEMYPDDNNKQYFTVVQHDDGVLFKLPMGTRIYSAGGNHVRPNHVPIPLIYEDRLQRLENLPKLAFKDKDILCSFVGSMTHSVRSHMRQTLTGIPGFELHFTEQWNEMVTEEKQQRFVDITRRSKFCLAPRGYGRTSFRFYEAFLLGAIPIYVWDDMEWLPYKDIGEVVDYRKFCISIHVTELPKLEQILNRIGEEEYGAMVAEYANVRRWFSLEGMTEYIVGRESLRVWTDRIFTNY